MKISIIIPTYKPHSYLWECMDSLKGQTLDRSLFEVVIVLNGCCEPYKTQIDDYVRLYMGGWNVKITQTDKPGVSNARNIGINLAKGEYIGFVDDDDYVSPTYLEELYRSAANNVVSASYTIGYLSFVGGRKRYLPMYYVQQHYEDRAKYGLQPYWKARCFSGPCMKLIHRDTIGDRRFDDSFKHGEDTLFLYEISDRFNKAQYTSRNAIYYRNFREGSAINNYPLKERMVNCTRLAWAYTKIYFKNPRQRSLNFYLSNILGVLKTIIMG